MSLPENPSENRSAAFAENVDAMTSGYWPAFSAGSLRDWLREGARTALLAAPRWERLQVHPLLLLGLLAGNILLAIGAQRLWIDGAAVFNWQPLLSGWLTTCATAWICFGLRPRSDHAWPEKAPGAGHLFGLLIAQGWLITLVYGGLWFGFNRVFGENAFYKGEFGAYSLYLMWGIWLAFLGWQSLANGLLLARGTGRKALAFAAVLLLCALYVVESTQGHENFWMADAPAAPEYEKPRSRLELTQDLMEQQPLLLSERLQALQAQRAGVIDVYALTFAPYANEDVFRRESAVVAEVLQQRFDAAGRTLQLVNHAETVTEWPWATSLNLQRAIEHVAQLMDREEDVFFIHLTSHGAQNGDLAAQFWPMTVEHITPQQLRRWLDEAGIRHRVISVSACYSGSWIEPLADENTLVMTAADAEHTSFGCGRRSELTYFGRAVFDEQLRTRTRSFEEAHAAARVLIDEREKEAGKDDGYSNPQIRTGSAVAGRLQTLREQLEKG